MYPWCSLALASVTSGCVISHNHISALLVRRLALTPTPWSSLTHSPSFYFYVACQTLALKIIESPLKYVFIQQKIWHMNWCHIFCTIFFLYLYSSKLQSWSLPLTWLAAPAAETHTACCCNHLLSLQECCRVHDESSFCKSSVITKPAAHRPADYELLGWFIRPKFARCA